MHCIKPLLTPQIPVFKSNLRFNQRLFHNLVIIKDEQKTIISHSYALPFKKIIWHWLHKKNGKCLVDSTSFIITLMDIQIPTACRRQEQDICAARQCSLTFTYEVTCTLNLWWRWNKKIFQYCPYNGISGPLGTECCPPYDSIKQILDQRMGLL